MGGKRDKPEVLPGDGTITLEREQIRKPHRYYVVMHNDDYTTQEFVVHVLVKFFYKSAAEATKLMLAVHTEGLARVGLFPKDIAETKADQVIAYARQNDMPLLLTVEPE